MKLCAVIVTFNRLSFLRKSLESYEKTEETVSSCVFKHDCNVLFDDIHI